MSTKPTLVLVPGAWHSSSTWDKVVSLLQTDHQYKSISVSLPSTAGDPSATVGDDIRAVREAIVRETSRGHDVVVVVHSYGGIVGPSAIKGVTKKDSPATKIGHVLGLAFIASGFPTTGVSFIDGLGGKPPPSWKASPSTGFADLVAPPRELFYHDLPVEEGDFWVWKLEKQSLKALFEGGEDIYSGWKDVPSWYLSTTDDRAFPVEAQRMLVQMARDQGGEVTVREVASSHSPMLSRPKETVEFLLEAVEAFTG